MNEARSLPQDPYPGAAVAFWRAACALRDAGPPPLWTPPELDALMAFNAAAGAPAAVFDQLERLGDSRALAVVAGQQAGLFVSPLYAVYKAMAAVKWARRLEALLERPVVPVFWIASEDHDFEEVRRAHYLDREGKAVSWTYTPSSYREGLSVYDIPVDSSQVAGFLRSIAEDTHPTEFKEETLASWRRMGETSPDLEVFFAKGLIALLGGQGLVLASPRLAPIRERAARVLRREISYPGESTALITAAGRTMEAEGERPPVHRRGDEANFFLYREGVRCKVTLENGRFAVFLPGYAEPLDRLIQADLLRELDEHPANFSPNVILRPIVQDDVLPVLAMVAGPGERDYLTMLDRAGVYPWFGVTPSRVLARPRLLLVEPRIERRLAKAGIPESLLAEENWEAVAEAFIRSTDHGAALDALDAWRLRQTEAFSDFSRQLGALADKPEVSSALARTASAHQEATDRLEKRLRDTILTGQETVAAQKDRCMQSLRPLGLPQERVLGPLAPFLVNYGGGVIPWILEHIDLDARNLQVLYLSRIHKKEE